MNNRMINNKVGVEFRKTDSRLKIRMSENVIIDSSECGIKNYYRSDRNNQQIVNNVISLSGIGIQVNDRSVS